MKTQLDDSELAMPAGLTKGHVKTQEMKATDKVNSTDAAGDTSSDPDTAASEEIGGPKGPEPTRYGDWERKGRCIDF